MMRVLTLALATSLLFVTPTVQAQVTRSPWLVPPHRDDPVPVRPYFRTAPGREIPIIPVPPHFRTPPDGIPENNYDFPGNLNPNRGRITPGNPFRERLRNP